MTREEKIKKIESVCKICQGKDESLWFCSKCEYSNLKNLSDEELEEKMEELEEGRRYDEKMDKLLSYCYSRKCNDCKLIDLCKSQSWVGGDEKELELLIEALNDRKPDNMSDTQGMTEETKEALQLALELLKVTLHDTGTYIGVLIDKDKPKCSKIVFLDKEAYLKGQHKGIKVDLNELNGFKEK